MLKIALALLALPIAVAPALARGGGGHASGGYHGTGSNPSAHSSSGYVTPRGTPVAPHTQTNPNSTMRDNYEAKGNVNPRTGAVGTRRVPY